MTPDEKESRDLAAFQWLADWAWKKLQSRRATEWKLCFGIWTALAAAAGFIVGGQVVLTIWQAAALSVIAVLILVIFATLWLPWIQRAHNRDARRGYWWESAIEELINRRLHPTLRPPNDGKGPPLTGRWLRYVDIPSENDSAMSSQPNASAGASEGRLKRLLDAVLAWLCPEHENAKAQLYITALFVLLFCMAVWSRSAPRTSATDSDPFATLKIQTPSRFTIDPVVPSSP